MKTFLFLSYRAVLGLLLIAGLILAFTPIMVLAIVAIWIYGRPKPPANLIASPAPEFKQLPKLVAAG